MRPAFFSAGNSESILQNPTASSHETVSTDYIELPLSPMTRF
jgi:hypothetical protein